MKSSVVGLEKTADITEYTFMLVHVKTDGKTDNQKFFIGRLPEQGEAVEMVYVGDNEEGGMKFQLRVRG